MKITFGLSIDGFLPSTPVFNHLFCGPLGLVESLELRLGIPKKSASPASRLYEYMIGLESISSRRECFYSASLKADRWGTAAVLLTMRDELRMGGWNGKDTPVPRLADFAEVEEELCGNFAVGMAERIENILLEIRGNSTGIDEVESVDSQKFLPHQIYRLMEALGAEFLDHPFQPEAQEGTNLRLVQDILSGKNPKGLDWQAGDDSVIFATAFSEMTLAHAAAQGISDKNPPGLLATAPARVLADVLQGYRKAVPGVDSPSRVRPIVQVLGLALEMRWNPPDPAVLLQFLTHPACPIEWTLRSALADAVAEQPGIGSKRWKQEIQRCRERVESDSSLGDKEKKSKLVRIEEDLQKWLAIPRFARESGAPGEKLAETARLVETWARMRANLAAENPEARHFLCLASQACELADIVERIPLLRPEELSRILEQACATAPSAGDRVSDLGACEVFEDAAAVFQPRDSIFWWGFENPETRISKLWSDREFRELQSAGIFLASAENRQARLHEVTNRVFLCARKQVVLLWPKSRGGDAVERHPALTLLEARLGQLPILDLDKGEGLPAGNSSLAKLSRPVRPLPVKKRWIRLPNPTPLVPRDEESYSSLSKFVLRPFEWVFNYPAKLRRGKLREINPFIQRGNLLHRVVELLLEPGAGLDWKRAGREEFDRWLDRIWPEFLEFEGSNLLQPGFQADGRKLLEEARRSVWTLFTHLKKAGVESAEADVRLGPIPLGSGRSPQISGFIDLLVANSKGECAVVDLKFGQKKAKRKELLDNTALQLAVYAKLLQADSSRWPDMAYYILRSGSLLAQTNTFFPDAEVIRSTTSGPQAIWDAFLKVWDWRSEQLHAGWIEFPIEGTKPNEEGDGLPDSTPPIPEWISDSDAPRYDDFQFLTGWEDSK